MASGPRNSKFYKNYIEIVKLNFRNEGDPRRERNLERITVQDYAKGWHLLPQFLSRVASPDSNNFLAVDCDDSFLTQFE